jgi:hypothetical protein
VTASQAFTLVIQPSQTQNRFSLQQKAIFAQFAESWLKASDLWEQLYIICKEATAGEPAGDPTAANSKFQAVEVAFTGAIGEIFNALAGDPADSNYTSIAQPTPPTVSLPSTNASWTAAEIATFKAWKTVIVTEGRSLG